MAKRRVPTGAGRIRLTPAFRPSKGTWSLQSTHYVHGAWHGGWCWELLTPPLQQEGHDVVTMDLPCDDGSASFDTYAEVVCDVLRRRCSARCGPMPPTARPAPAHPTTPRSDRVIPCTTTSSHATSHTAVKHNQRWTTSTSWVSVYRSPRPVSDRKRTRRLISDLDTTHTVVAGVIDHVGRAVCSDAGGTEHEGWGAVRAWRAGTTAWVSPTGSRSLP